MRELFFMVGRFFLLYIVLLMLYQFYLNQYTSLDPLSRTVGMQSCSILSATGQTGSMIEVPGQKYTRVAVDNVPVSRMVEGCNAVSVMILYVSFLFAFYRGRITWIFALTGVLLLYVVNLFRIAGINYILYNWREYGKAAHEYAFPAVIYGTVILLWVLYMYTAVSPKKQIDEA